VRVPFWGARGKFENENCFWAGFSTKDPNNSNVVLLILLNKQENVNLLKKKKFRAKKTHTGQSKHQTTQTAILSKQRRWMPIKPSVTSHQQFGSAVVSTHPRTAQGWAQSAWCGVWMGPWRSTQSLKGLELSASVGVSCLDIQ
jgi:hypothetical protein